MRPWMIVGKKSRQRRAQRLRTLAALASVLFLAAFLVSGFWFIQFELPFRLFVRNSDGKLAVGRLNPELPPGLIGFSVMDGMVDGPGELAWRPYHADEGFAHSIIFPLWQPLVLCVGLLAYAQGYLHGRRLSDPSRCADCGYELRGLPIVEGVRTCPECGRKQVVSAA